MAFLQREGHFGDQKNIRLRPWRYALGHKRPMSELGQKQTSRSEIAMSALPPKAAIAEHDQDVRFVPIADIGQPSPGSARLDLSRGGSPHWIKVKNPKAPAVKRGAEEDWGR
jgi:hypothetical protein